MDTIIIELASQIYSCRQWFQN